MIPPHVTQDTDVAEEVAAAELSEIQLAYDDAMALLAVISRDWETAVGETLEQGPAPTAGPRAVAVPVASQSQAA